MISSHNNRTGILLTLAFVLIGSAQEVYLGRLFQEEDPIIVMTVTFIITAIFFALVQSLRTEKIIQKTTENLRTVIGLNITTVISWIGFFLALKHIEPAVVSMITFAVSPILAVVFWRVLRPDQGILPLERYAAVGILAGLCILTVGTSLGRSAVGILPDGAGTRGLLWALSSAVGVVGNTVYAKRLSEKGFSSTSVMAIRFPLLIGVGLFLWPGSQLIHLPFALFLVKMIFLATLTLIIPLFLFQLGIERCEPITITLVLSSMPVLTYGLQLFDSRLKPSAVTLVGIIVALVAASVGVVGRSRKTAT